MIIVDKALEQRHKESNPIKVAVVGAGFMARGIALQLIQFVPGFHLAAICNRNIAAAKKAYSEAGVESVVIDSSRELEHLIRADKYCVTDNPGYICRAGNIDVIVEVTGTIDYGVNVVMEAIEHGKHVVMMNAELDSTLGPYLKHLADCKGVVISNSDGDQPGVIMNLFRFVKGMGFSPVMCGNIKGLQDPYRTPTTQAAFAERWKQKPNMVTSFADGSKISFEQAIVANATNMKVGCRGMFGPTVEPGTPVEKVIDLFPESIIMNENGIVDYVVGASPGPGVFVVGTHDHPKQKHYLELYKLGEGPFYTFYTPYHLCHFEIHNSIARAAIFSDAVIAPDFGLKVAVVATAKRDLEKGEVIDGIGEYMTYGQCENAETVYRENLLPLGLASTCKLRHQVTKDSTLTFDDVHLNRDRIPVKLWYKQKRMFCKTTEEKSIELMIKQPNLSIM